MRDGWSRESACGRLFVLGTAWAVLACASLLAAEPDSLRRGPDIGDTILHDIEAVGLDALVLLSAPASFDAVDWSIAAGALGGTMLVMSLDDDARRLALRNRSEGGNAVSRVGNTLGLLIPAGALSGAIYLGGLALDEPGVRRAGRHAAQSLLYAGLATSVLKIAIGRERPQFGNGPFTYDAFSSSDRFHALPSGHATVAFAMASSLAADIDHPAATVVLYGLATLTAASRVYDDRHWTSDIFLGSAIGAACGYAVANMDNASEEGSSIFVVPSTDRLTIVWRLR